MEPSRPARPPAAPLVAVLAGGLGRRLGGAKPGTVLAGRTLLSYPLQSAESAGFDAIVLAKRSTPMPREPGAPVIYEPDLPHHPLCGVVAALRHVGARAAAGPRRPVLVVGCDMPFLAPELLAELGRRQGCIVALEIGGRPAPFPLLVRDPPPEILEHGIAAGSSMRSVLAELEPELMRESELARFGDPARLCFSVNSADDLEVAAEWLAADAARAPEARS